MEIIIVLLLVIVGILYMMISTQKMQIATLKRSLLDCQYLEYTDDNEEDYEEALYTDCEIDFEKMGVVAIERLPDGRANLGYVLNDNYEQVSEWSMSINNEQYKKLLEKFEQYIASRY